MISKDEKELHKGHRNRMKTRFMKFGLDTFAEHEVLELALYYSIHQQDTNKIAHMLINEFGNLKGVMDAPRDELVKVKYITDNTVTLLKLIPQIARIYSSQAYIGPPIGASDDIIEMFLGMYAGVTNETLACACFGHSHKVCAVTMFPGGKADFTSSNIEGVIKFAVKSEAESVAVAHNHPDYASELPSPEDIAATGKLMEILNSVGISLLDHIIIFRNEGFSMRKESYLLFN
jgi:DNA repair protein RadC